MMRVWMVVCLGTLHFLPCIAAASMRGQTSMTSKEKQGKHKREMWLDDITKDYLYEMQGDAPASPAQSAQCPPPPKQVPQTACKAEKCSSDARCGGGQRCCNNGCTFTCMLATPVPQAVDWIREPPRRSKSGNSWLVPGKEQDEQVEWCSTNLVESDEDALLCPHGYQCHIEDLGDPEDGVPNRGRCVKQRKKRKNGSGRSFRLKSDSSDVTQCVFHDRRIENQQHFYYHHHPCSCMKGSIECQVGAPRSLPRQAGKPLSVPPASTRMPSHRAVPNRSHSQIEHRTPARIASTRMPSHRAHVAAPPRSHSRVKHRTPARIAGSRTILISNG